MKTSRIATLLMVLTFSVGGLFAGTQSAPSAIDSANRLFQAGKFADAEKIYTQIVTRNPRDDYAAQQLGHIALLSNQLEDAQRWLQKAIALKADNNDAKIMLAEVFLSARRFPEGLHRA